jgi:hypothetical protein
MTFINADLYSRLCRNLRIHFETAASHLNVCWKMYVNIAMSDEHVG